MASFKLNYYISLWNYIHYPGTNTLASAICEIGEMGYGVELWPHFASLHPYKPVARGDGYLLGAEYLTQLRTALGNVPSCWHGRRYLEGSPASVTNTLAGHLEQIDSASALGSAIISVHDLGDNPSSPFAISEDLNFAQTVLTHAKQRNVVVALETIDEFDRLTSVVERLDLLQLCLDPAYIYCFTNSQLSSYVEAFGARICYLHLYDNTEDNYHLPPGSGNVPLDDWIYLLGTLQTLNFSGPVVFEIKPAPGKEGQNPLETATEAIEFLEELMQKYL